MFLSDFSVKRPIAMIVLIIALMGLGLAAVGAAARRRRA